MDRVRRKTHFGFADYSRLCFWITVHGQIAHGTTASPTMMKPSTFVGTIDEAPEYYRYWEDLKI